MGNLSNGDHGQGKYCLSSLLKFSVSCYKAFHFAPTMFNIKHRADFLFSFLLKHVMRQSSHYSA